jgi:hypothetical protein
MSLHDILRHASEKMATDRTSWEVKIDVFLTFPDACLQATALSSASSAASQQKTSLSNFRASKVSRPAYYDKDKGAYTYTAFPNFILLMFQRPIKLLSWSKVYK